MALSEHPIADALNDTRPPLALIPADSDRIAELVRAAVLADVLDVREPMNPPGAEFESRDVYVGRNAHGDRVYLSVRLARRDGAQQSTEHETVIGAWELSLSGGTVDKGRKGPDREGGDWSSCGQITGEFRRVIGVKGVKAVADIWDAHHLNGMTAACAHQSAVGADIGERLDNTPPCPETGYRYGHAWLWSPLPADAVETVLTFLAERVAANAKRGK